MAGPRRPGSRPPAPGGSRAGEDRPVETAAPGIAALLDRAGERESGAVLDLGAGVSSSLAVYSRFVREVCFADVLGYMRSGTGKGGVAGMLEAIPDRAEPRYDLVFAWDILDRLFDDYRAPLVERLARVTTPDGRLHLVVRSSGETPRPLRFALLGPDRMRYQPAGPPQPAGKRLLPAEVAALLEPFRVVHGFTLRGDLREYVAIRGRDAPPGEAGVGRDP